MLKFLHILWIVTIIVTGTKADYKDNNKAKQKQQLAEKLYVNLSKLQTGKYQSQFLANFSISSYRVKYRIFWSFFLF